MTDWAAVYRANIDAVTALAETLSNEQLSLRVPATPEWTVHDVLAHLAGGPADLLADRMDDAPTPTWTERHVDERAARTPADLMDEMRGNLAAVVATLDGNERPAIVWDCTVHHADLHEALGLGVPPEPMWSPVLAAVAPMKFGATQLPPDIDEYELFRALFSRRSRTQMQAWGLPLSPDQLDDLCIFGPREDDQPVP
jgi:uncharacterized protein (TIGR03083 family)